MTEILDGLPNEEHELDLSDIGGPDPADGEVGMEKSISDMGKSTSEVGVIDVEDLRRVAAAASSDSKKSEGSSASLDAVCGSDSALANSFASLSSSDGEWRMPPRRAGTSTSKNSSRAGTTALPPVKEGLERGESISILPDTNS